MMFQNLPKDRAQIPKTTLPARNWLGTRFPQLGYLHACSHKHPKQKAGTTLSCGSAGLGSRFQFAPHGSSLWSLRPPGTTLFPWQK